MMFKTVLILFLIHVKFSWSHVNLFEGDNCTTRTGQDGICINIRNCSEAIENIVQGVIPTTCSFFKSDPIVCCVEPDVKIERRVSTTPVSWDDTADTSPIPLTTQRTDAKFLGANVSSERSCPPISPKKTAAKTGRKAWDKCIDYQEQLVYPCDEGQGVRINNCWNDINTFILGGTDSYEGEFPHMALIGYGDNASDLSFFCGGTLISEKFVMTAGHCSSTSVAGGISHVLLGTLKRSEYKSSNLYRVAKVHKHPDYKAPIKYNDIALLETEVPVTMSEYIVPACLDLADALVTGDSAIATGWGITSLRGDPAAILQKVTLTKFSTTECNERYKPTRLQRKGFDPDTQLCFGAREASKDTCQGDSGGPIQVKSEQIHCMYTVVGITSFGRSCGIAGEPALYTKVAHYVPWVESIVWPDE